MKEPVEIFSSIDDMGSDKTLTVAGLRALIKDLPDEMPVVVNYDSYYSVHAPAITVEQLHSITTTRVAPDRVRVDIEWQPCREDDWDCRELPANKERGAARDVLVFQ
jgi:hypothetical protein